MSATTIINKNGKLLTQRVWDLIDHVESTLGLTLVVVQGGFRKGNGASASSGTHDDGDVYDIGDDNLTRSESLLVVNELRMWYGDAWLRSPEFGWTSTGSHIHVVQEDSFYKLSDEALQQVSAYNNHRNGLANNHADPHPQPARRHFPLVVAPPTPAPAPNPNLSIMEDTMFLAIVKYGANSTSFWLCGSPKGMVNLSSDEAASWTGARLSVNDQPTWLRMIARFGPQT